MTTGVRTVRRPLWSAVVAVTVLTLGLGLVGGTARPAAATTVTPGAATVVCSELGGDVAHRRIDGDLLVDAFCEATRASVRGDVIVAPAGRFRATSFTVKGDLRVAGSADLWRSSVYGGVLLGAPEASLVAVMTTIRRSIRGEGRRLLLSDARVEGNVTVGTRVDTTLTRSTVGGWVTVRGGALDISVSRLGRGLTSSDATGVHLCGTPIGGDTTIARPRGLVRVGDGFDPGGPCIKDGWDPPTEISGDLVLHDVDQGAELYGYLGVSGDLLCTGTTGAGGLTIEYIFVQGSRTGVCAA